MKGIIKELKSPRLIKVTVGYLTVAWVLLQVFSLLLPLTEAPIWVLKTLTLILIIGFPIWVLFSMNYQITTDGLIKIEGTNTRFYKRNKFIITLIVLLVISPVLYFILNTEEKINATEDLTNKSIMIDTFIENKILSTNLVALDFYLKGEFHQKRQSLTDIDLAIQNYLNAIKNDSLFAMAYNNLGSAYMRKNLSFDPNMKWEEEAYSAAGKALQLDPKLPNPHIIIGQFYWSPSHNFAHEVAIKEFEKAISKDPSLSRAYEQLSLVQLHIGLYDKAISNVKKCINLDPINYRAKRFIAEAYLFQGEYDKALKEFNKIPESFVPEPTLAFKAITNLYLNQDEKAIEILDKNLIKNPNSPHLNAVYAIILSSQGKIDAAIEKMNIAEQNIDDFIHAHHIYYYLGVASALLNEKQIAMQWLEKAANFGFPNYPLYSSDPKLANLKDYQEFLDFLSNLKTNWEYYKTI